MTTPQTLTCSVSNVNWFIPECGFRASQTIEISNSLPTPFLFKIMCTNVKRYIIKPSNGLLKPFEKRKIEILLDIPKDTPTTSPMKDAFLLASLIGTTDALDKESLDEYIRQNQSFTSKIKIYSFINFTKSASKAESQTQSIQTGQNLFENPQNEFKDEKIYESVITNESVVKKEAYLDFDKNKDKIKESIDVPILIKKVAENTKEAIHKIGDKVQGVKENVKNEVHLISEDERMIKFKQMNFQLEGEVKSLRVK